MQNDSAKRRCIQAFPRRVAHARTVSSTALHESDRSCTVRRRLTAERRRRGAARAKCTHVLHLALINPFGLLSKSRTRTSTQSRLSLSFCFSSNITMFADSRVNQRMKLEHPLLMPQQLDVARACRNWGHNVGAFVGVKQVSVENDNKQRTIRLCTKINALFAAGRLCGWTILDGKRAH